MGKHIAVIASLFVIFGCSTYRSYQAYGVKGYILQGKSETRQYSKQSGPYSIYPELEKQASNLKEGSESLVEYKIGLNVIYAQGANQIIAETELRDNLVLDSLAIIFDDDKSTFWTSMLEATPIGGISYPGMHYKFRSILVTKHGSKVTLKVPFGWDGLAGAFSPNYDTLFFDFVNQVEYPNPFSPTANIIYEIPVGCHVVLTLYNTSGKKVVVLVDEFQPKGQHEVLLEPFDLPSGVYFYKLQAGDYVETKKMVLLR